MNCPFCHQPIPDETVLSESERCQSYFTALSREMSISLALYEALKPFGEVGKAFLDARERLERGNGASAFTLPAEWVEWCIRAVAALAKARGESQ